jgi:hypothetical protein
MNKFKEHFDPIPFLAYGVLGLWAASFLIAFFVSCVDGTAL